jgi:recombination protein RecT
MNELVKSQKTLEGLLGSDNIRGRFNEMLGKKSAGFISSIISAVNLNPDLKKADPMTVVSAAAVAASLDLPINPSLGFAHIVPYSGRAQFQIGWRGYVQLGQRSGQYRTINVAIVREGELKRYDKFTGEMEFDSESKTSEKIIGYVAYFRLLNGFEKYFYMTTEEVTAHGKRYSKSYSNPNSRWQQDFDAMALKTVIKLLLNRWGILSVDMQQALRADQAVVKESGDFEYVDSPEAEVIPVVSQEKIEEFKELTEAKGFEPILPAFIDEMAKHNKITPEQVMEGALEDFEGFWQYYLVWKLKQPTVENMTTPEPDAPTEAEVQQTLLDRGMVSEKGKGKSK